MWQWTLTASDWTPRFDTFLAARLSFLPRRAIATLIATGQARVNGRREKKGKHLSAGDTVTTAVPLPVRGNATLPIGVIYVDDTLVVLDKPAGIPSLALYYDDTETVANFLVARFPETAAAGPQPFEAGLVHRLDTATSGLLLAARTSSAYFSLRAQFRSRTIGSRTIEKRYLALVEGSFQLSGAMTCHLAPQGLRGHRMREVAAGKGQEALAAYAPVEVLPKHTLVGVTLITGVRHQIRAHLSALGHPIVGDSLYGTAEPTARLCLHAQTLTFIHPATGQALQLVSPLPADFCALLESRREAEKLEPVLSSVAD